MGAVKDSPDLDGDEREALMEPDQTAGGAGASGPGFEVDADHRVSSQPPQPKVLRSGIAPAPDSWIVPQRIEAIHRDLAAASPARQEGTTPAGPGPAAVGNDAINDVSSPDLDLSDPDVLRHEIANPMTALSSAATLLGREISFHNCPQAERLHALILIIQQSADQVMGVINSPKKIPSDLPISDPSKNPDFKKIHLSDVLSKMVESWKILADVDGISFDHKIAEGINIRGNTVKLLEVLSNVVSNAMEVLRNTDSPAISVTIRIHPKARGLVQIFVRDNGPGITAATRKKIFTKGFSGKEGGHGIGLWRSKRLVHEMGGFLDLINNTDRHDLDDNEKTPGATAVIELPLYYDEPENQMSTL